MASFIELWQEFQMKKSNLEQIFHAQLIALGITCFEREYRFAPGRRYRADFAWPELMILVEIEGGTWDGGRHTRGKGFQGDCRKYNLAASLGWRVFRGDSQMVRTGELVNFMEGVIKRSARAGAKAESNEVDGQLMMRYPKI